MKNIKENLHTLTNITSSINVSMMNESKEDGQYIKFPEEVEKPYSITPSMYKQMSRYYDEESLASKQEAYKKELEIYKEYKKEITRISGENFEILLSKIKKAITDGSAKLGIDPNTKLGENEMKYFKNTIDSAYMVLDGKRYYITDYTSKKGRRLPVDAYMENIVLLITNIAALYNIDLPSGTRYSDEFLEKFSFTSASELDQRSNKHRNEEQYTKFVKKLYDKYKKETPKMEKIREKFKKTKQYKDILEILEYCEKDYKKLDSKYESWKERFAKNTKYKNAMEKVTPMHDEMIKKVFHDKYVTTYSTSECPDLMTALILTYARTDEMPEVKVVNQETSSWISGMEKSCNFEVIGSDGKKILTSRYEDGGLNAEGFSPWD